MEQQDSRKLSKSARETLRHKVVRAVIELGMKQRQAAELFGVSQNSVSAWVRAYRALGGEALKTKRMGRPEGATLTHEQAQSVRRSLTDKYPEQFSLPGALWTVETVSALIEGRYSIRLSRWTVSRYLRYWGVPPQKLSRIAQEQNPQQARYWLQNKYPELCRRARQENALVLWMHETDLRVVPHSGPIYGKYGKVLLPGRGRRPVVSNMFSAHSNQGKLAFMVFKERVRPSIVLLFLQRLTEHYSRKIFLIVNRRYTYIPAILRKWLEEHADTLQLFYRSAGEK